MLKSNENIHIACYWMQNCKQLYPDTVARSVLYTALSFRLGPRFLLPTVPINNGTVLKTINPSCKTSPSLMVKHYNSTLSNTVLFIFHLVIRYIVDTQWYAARYILSLFLSRVKVIFKDTAGVLERLLWFFGRIEQIISILLHQRILFSVFSFRMIFWEEQITSCHFFVHVYSILCKWLLYLRSVFLLLYDVIGKSYVITDSFFISTLIQ